MGDVERALALGWTGRNSGGRSSGCACRLFHKGPLDTAGRDSELTDFFGVSALLDREVRYLDVDLLTNRLLAPAKEEVGKLASVEREAAVAPSQVQPLVEVFLVLSVVLSATGNGVVCLLEDLVRDVLANQHVDHARVRADIGL